MAMFPGTMQTSLYVGDLHHEVTNDMLYNSFSQFTTLTSVRVCRDFVTGNSLCYGYVNFLSAEDAIQAIELKNHSSLYGKVMRVMWSHRDPIARKNGVGNVFIKNLEESVDNVKLQELFQIFGNILSCKVATSEEDCKSKGYGFVQFETQESATAAIDNLNGTIVGDKQIYVGKFVRKSDRASLSLEAKFTNLYMKNVDVEVDEEVLKEKFSEFGKIVSLVISKDENGSSRGFGFVSFESPDDAKRALETMNGSQLGSKVLYVAKAQKKSERAQMLRRQFEDKRKEHILKYHASNVYVKNIDDNVNDDELGEHFSQCGTITSAKIMRDEKGLSKGFGFVCFSRPEEANNAVDSFHGCVFHRKPLYVAIAQRKEERKAKLQLQYVQHQAGLMGQPALFPSGYHTYYVTTPPGVVAQVPSRPGLMYQPLGLVTPAWRANGFAPQIGPGYQPSVPWMARNPRQNRQSWGRANGHLRPQGGEHGISHQLNFEQSPKALGDSNNQQINGNVGELNKSTSDSVGLEESGMLSSKLAAASPDQQKQMLGERLFPLVGKLSSEPDFAAKVTGMLLEMDNSELLLLLESPESLASEVQKAEEVLKLTEVQKAEEVLKLTEVQKAEEVLKLTASQAASEEEQHSGNLSAQVTVTT